MRKAFISPTKYVQGEDELLNLGYFVKSFGESALLIAHPDDVQRVKAKLDATAEKFNITFVESGFKGNVPVRKLLVCKRSRRKKDVTLPSVLVAVKRSMLRNV